MDLIKKDDYLLWIKNLKEKVRVAQIKASIRVNTTLLEFYWELGREIIEKEKKASWGSSFLNQLSKDLTREFPDLKGFSKRNLEYIRKWYSFYSCEGEKTKQLVSQFQIPWGHNIKIIQKCKDKEEAIFYVNKTIENNWSRAVLVHQIESGLYSRSGKAITNFEATLPKVQSDLAKELIKDPYNFDFLTLTENYTEKELESNLTEHITKFLLELGAGFAYMGKQVELKVGERSFYIDLLFYHTRLHCYVVVELKIVDFEPEFAGKLNFYLQAVDKQIKQEADGPTIGILLCKNKDKTVVEYALSDVTKPIGVSEYQLTRSLPDKLKSVLPTIEELEAELGDIDE